MTLSTRRLAVIAVLATGVVLTPSVPVRVDRLLEAGPGLTLEVAVADVLVLAGTAAALYLGLSAVTLLVLDVVAPRSRALRLALRLTPERWRRLVLVTAGVAVVVVGAAPTGSAAPRVGADRDHPDLSGLRLPERPEAPERVVAAPTRTSWVEVLPGDCLWDLARQRLPAGASDAAVARSTAAWHRANRSRIGPDADLLLPGTRLRQPAPPHPDPTTRDHP
ncbi:MAG: hypothetical protein Q7T56_07195 [Nocardioidaceae bacterium]|nr:hypothetical protein [Nocardioidaceae bacterium]